jgi:hypothetical protein
MYEEHRAFETPPDTCVIWRYMSFTKFAWLIATECLYFSRLDKHPDEWEGLVSTKPENTEHRKYIRFTKYINCWHINNDESDAMWKLYGPSGETIAIKSTVGALKTSLEDGTPVFIGKVNYSEDKIPDGNLYWPVVFKRKPFQHEEELRLCVSSPRNDNPPDLTQLKKELAFLGVSNPSDMKLLKGIGPKGISVSIDVNQLLQEVVICPSAGHYLNEAVNYILKSKTYDIRIGKSRL